MAGGRGRPAEPELCSPSCVRPDSSESAPYAAGEGPEEAAAKRTPKTLPVAATPDLDLTGARVHYLEELDLLVFEQTVAGRAGATVPEAAGQLDGAPVLGYVFPTSLAPGDVGFGTGEGTVALAMTAHPDFDDTPLWDENNDRDYGNDGVIFHTHWVVLVADDRVPGGLAVAEISEGESARVLPPTHPGMPMLMDSPGYSVLLQGATLKILVPAQRIHHRTDFRFDAVTAYMEVSTSGGPMLGVYQVYEVLSGDLSLPYRVQKE